MIPNQVNAFRIILAEHSQYYPIQHQYAKDFVLCEVELNIYKTIRSFCPQSTNLPWFTDHE